MLAFPRTLYHHNNKRERENIGILVLVKLPTFQDKIKGGWTPSYHKQWQQRNNNAGKLRVKNLLLDRYSGKLYIKTWKKTVLKPAWADWCMMRITSESVWKSYRVTHTALTWSPYLWKKSIPHPQKSCLEKFNSNYNTTQTDWLTWVLTAPKRGCLSSEPKRDKRFQ